MKIIQVSGNEIRKVFRYIKTVFSKDSHTAAQIAPFGDDSCPVEGMKGVEASTDDLGQNVVIGYFNRSILADKGEKRFYSLKADKTESFYIWLKNDGTCEIGGDTDNLVRYSELKEGFDKLKEDLNDLVLKYNSHTHMVSELTSTATSLMGSSSTADISDSKIDELKTL